MSAAQFEVPDGLAALLANNPTALANLLDDIARQTDDGNL